MISNIFEHHIEHQFNSMLTNIKWFEISAFSPRASVNFPRTSFKHQIQMAKLNNGENQHEGNSD